MNTKATASQVVVSNYHRNYHSNSVRISKSAVVEQSSENFTSKNFEIIIGSDKIITGKNYHRVRFFDFSENYGDNFSDNTGQQQNLYRNDNQLF